jgi:hypothetical protein
MRPCIQISVLEKEKRSKETAENQPGEFSQCQMNKVWMPCWNCWILGKLDVSGGLNTGSGMLSLICGKLRFVSTFSSAAGNY